MLRFVSFRFEAFIGRANTKYADKIWCRILDHGPGFYSFPAVAVTVVRNNTSHIPLLYI